MYQIIYEKLVQLARSGNVITYSELAGLVHLQMESPADLNQLSHNLGQINRQEHNQGHPMISAVVVRAHKNGPGDGFYKFATELGLYGGSHIENDKLDFWTGELKKYMTFGATSLNIPGCKCPAKNKRGSTSIKGNVGRGVTLRAPGCGGTTRCLHTRAHAR